MLSTLKKFCVGEDIVNTSNEYVFTLERHHMVEEISFHNIQVGRLQGAWIISCLDLEANGVSCEGIPEAFAYREIRRIVD